MQANIDTVVANYFEGVARAPEPVLCVIAGPVASGKTRYRRRFKPGEYVHLDAGDVFNALGGPDSPDFPGELEEAMNEAGLRIATRAIAERYSVLLEVSGDRVEDLTLIAQDLRPLGYRVELVGLSVDLDRSLANNEARGPDNISSYFAQDYHLAWLADAARHARS